MSIKKPVPAHSGRERRLGPYCQQPSYSTSGVHPQCMQRGNDLLAKRQAAQCAAGLASHLA